MKAKHHIIFLIILLIISIFLLLYINLPKNEIKFYSDNPEKWITTKGNLKSIDIKEVTKGSSYIDDLGLQYNDKEISTAFTYNGFYNGEYFDREFINGDGKILMRISKDIKPNDGVIDGFIIEKIQDNKPFVYVFVDEDWKKSLGRTYIWYGKNYEHKKIFSFKEISDGIYMDSFEDEPERFLEQYTIHFGGIIVGDISEEKIKNKDTDITLIKFS